MFIFKITTFSITWYLTPMEQYEVLYNDHPSHLQLQIFHSVSSNINPPPLSPPSRRKVEFSALLLILPVGKDALTGDALPALVFVSPVPRSMFPFREQMGAFPRRSIIKRLSWRGTLIIFDKSTSRPEYLSKNHGRHSVTRAVLCL